ncbi:T6SS immunity protein Tli3 family protein [Burkholderia cenocepacia]|uniref:T6SS immunity protein Tli3 family protein n=1 Tax=Burkholderia cenocepacia TaxID=95486 RepID=UPI001CF3979C|nr:hypothetical protein [Burkholderia cenocepacia]MCA8235201.1 hypothetical protein [Burkholderia cenocepacia]
MVRNFVIVALLLLMQGCSAPRPYSFYLADFLSAKELPYDSPPQVIYRIDDHRFVTLERYRDCHHGESFYNDTKAHIRIRIGNGRIENFQGRLINADPTGMNIVLPLSYPHPISCGDRGCTVPLWYSTDGGATFHLLTYMPHSFKPFEDSRRYTIVATKDRLYVEKHRQYDSYVVSYPLIPGFVYDGKSDIPDSKHVEYDTTVPPGLRTPSGQDRITCDATIKPTNPNAPLVR